MKAFSTTLSILLRIRSSVLKSVPNNMTVVHHRSDQPLCPEVNSSIKISTLNKQMELVNYNTLVQLHKLFVIILHQINSVFWTLLLQLPLDNPTGGVHSKTGYKSDNLIHPRVPSIINSSHTHPHYYNKSTVCMTLALFSMNICNK